MLAQQAIQLGASLVAIIMLAWLAHWLKLGDDVRIRDEDHAKTLASEAVFGFEASEVNLDKARIAAILKDKQGRQMILKRHGAQFVGRLLTKGLEARLDQNFLTIGTGERFFGKVTLNLGDAAQYCAADLRHLKP